MYQKLLTLMCDGYIFIVSKQTNETINTNPPHKGDIKIWQIGYMDTAELVP